jgi:hypothetical protein
MRLANMGEAPMPRDAQKLSIEYQRGLGLKKPLHRRTDGGDGLR